MKQWLTKTMQCAAQAAFLSLLALAACGSAEDDGLCEDAFRKLRRCGLLSEGTTQCVEPVGAEERCGGRCLLDAPCEELASLVCDGSDGAGTELALCVQQCEAAGGSDGGEFSCGDGETIPQGWRCDGEEDCTSGADEVRCPTFACRDGETIPQAYRCDMDPDCADGSDEDGCARLTCGE